LERRRIGRHPIAKHGGGQSQRFGAFVLLGRYSNTDVGCSAEVGRLAPADLRGDIKAVVTLYRRSRDARNSISE